MKCNLFLLVLFVSPLIAFSQSNQNDTTKPDLSKKILTVEASCGQCQFGLPGKSCDLAVKIKGKAHFVKGSHIDAHGDAHADDGFCETIRMAEIQGELVNDTFNLTYIKIGKPIVAKK